MRTQETVDNSNFNFLPDSIAMFPPMLDYTFADFRLCNLFIGKHPSGLQLKLSLVFRTAVDCLAQSTGLYPIKSGPSKQ
jgi:hypothetical protein